MKANCKKIWQKPMLLTLNALTEALGNCVGGSTGLGGNENCTNGQDTGHPGCEIGANTTIHECIAGGNTSHKCNTGGGVHG